MNISGGIEFCKDRLKKNYIIIPKKKVRIWEGKIILNENDCQFYAVKDGKRRLINFNVFTDKKGKLIFIEDKGD